MTQRPALFFAAILAAIVCLAPGPPLDPKESGGQVKVLDRRIATLLAELPAEDPIPLLRTLATAAEAIKERIDLATEMRAAGIDVLPAPSAFRDVEWQLKKARRAVRIAIESSGEGQESAGALLNGLTAQGFRVLGEGIGTPDFRVRVEVAFAQRRSFQHQGKNHFASEVKYAVTVITADGRELLARFHDDRLAGSPVSYDLAKRSQQRTLTRIIERKIATQVGRVICGLPANKKSR